LQDFGAIVELAANATLGLLHISEIAHHRTVAVTDELQLGQVR
jgi:predicted RNA-binding protein with RPS1 domain